MNNKIKIAKNLKTLNLFKKITIYILIYSILFSSCSINQTNGNGLFVNDSVITIVNWNTQTFFDANKSGFEYQDFLKNGDWTKEKYIDRLQRLCSVITELNADIYVFEEIENEDIIYDISNQLAENGHNWNQKEFWNYSFFAKQKETSIGIGIISRFPLINAKTHSMDIRIHESSQPSTRYILEVTAVTGDRNITIFANHWKSKSGGEEKSEIWRDWQECILGHKISQIVENQSSERIVVCGDFNRDAADFFCNLKTQKNYICDEENTFLRFADFGFTDYISINSPWFNNEGNFYTQTGSYYFDNEWERIDSIFTLGKIQVADFNAVIKNPWASAKGIPMSYKIYSGEGYSDHLPIMAKLILTD